MAVRQRIGLRQVRALKPGETIWDASLTGFGARRQQARPFRMSSTIATTKDASAGTRLVGMVRPGLLNKLVKRPSAF
jgi:hypothetical protein